MPTPGCLRSSLRSSLKSIGQCTIVKPPACSQSVQHLSPRCAGVRLQHSQTVVDGEAADARYNGTQKLDRVGQQPSALRPNRSNARTSTGRSPSASTKAQRASPKSASTESQSLRANAKLVRNIVIKDQYERYSPGTSEIPDAISRMLREERCADPNPYVIRAEAVRLVPGRRARFRTSPNAAICEIMLRTGCHVQAMDVTIEDESIDETEGGSFGSLSLWGTVAQIAEATKLIPSMIIEMASTDAILSDGDGGAQADSAEESMEDSKAGAAILAGRQPFPESQTHARVVRTVWTEAPADDLESVADSLADRPKDWNALTLATYISRLLVVRRPVIIRKEMLLKAKDQTGQTGQTPTERIIAELRHLMIDNAEVAPHITSQVVDEVLNFLLHHSRHPDLNDIFTSLEQTPRYVPTISNHNVFLEHAARRGDMYNFQRLLHTTLEKGHKPTWQTWVALHKLAAHRPASKLMGRLSRMLQKNGVLANPQATKAIAVNSIRFEIGHHFRHNGTLTQFLAMYDQRFAASNFRQAPSGREQTFHRRTWASTDAIVAIVSEMLSLKRFEDVRTLLAQFTPDEAALPVQILRSMLMAAIRARDPPAVVGILTRFKVDARANHGMPLKWKTMTMLYKFAWQMQAWNMLRVIWRYACLTANTEITQEWMTRNSIMRYSLDEQVDDALDGKSNDAVQLSQNLNSILSAAARSKTQAPKAADMEGPIVTERDLFEVWAGKFIAGVLDGSANTARESGLSRTERSLLDTVSMRRRDTDDKEHSRRKLKLGNLVLEDLMAWEAFEPDAPFHEKLAEAERLDAEWRAKRLDSYNQIARELTWAKLEGLSPKQKKATVLDLLSKYFEEMLVTGIHVPVVLKEELRMQHCADAIESPGPL